jgi:molybdopterin-guanine dinucleotide biosynthesis protein A
LHSIDPSIVEQYKGDMFFNINTKEDLARANRIVGR